MDFRGTCSKAVHKPKNFQLLSPGSAAYGWFSQANMLVESQRFTLYNYHNHHILYHHILYIFIYYYMFHILLYIITYYYISHSYPISTPGLQQQVRDPPMPASSSRMRTPRCRGNLASYQGKNGEFYEFLHDLSRNPGFIGTETGPKLFIFREETWAWRKHDGSSESSGFHLQKRWI